MEIFFEILLHLYGEWIFSFIPEGKRNRKHRILAIAVFTTVTSIIMVMGIVGLLAICFEQAWGTVPFILSILLTAIHVIYGLWKMKVSNGEEGMNVLVIGNGGREHAVIAALSRSPKVNKIYAMKGNAGIAQLAELVNVDYCDVKAVGDWVDAKGDIDFTVVTPDDPLALGLVDELESRGHRAFGPNKNAAIIEASKAFSKELMKKYNIPTAKYETFSDYESAAAYVKTCDIPVVLKADGLALGKGVLICKTREEAVEGVKEMMLDKKFGSAGNKVVVEEFLEGP